MVPIQTILCATDFSDGTTAALRAARGLARDHGSRLVVLYVAPNLFLPEGGMVAPLDLDADRAALEQVRGRLDGPDLKEPVVTLLAQGDPADEILHAADQVAADLVVVGSHGRGAIGRLLMGSVAEQVLRRSNRPVLIAKAPLPVPEPAQAPAVDPALVF